MIWALGKFVAIGVNAPKKYPKPPKKATAKQDPEPMDDQTLKESLLMFADIHNSTI